MKASLKVRVIRKYITPESEQVFNHVPISFATFSLCVQAQNKFKCTFIVSDSILFQLSEIQYGGAVVFPKLNLTVSAPKVRYQTLLSMYYITALVYKFHFAFAAPVQNAHNEVIQ